jgi:hypothetical protein
MYKTNDHFYLGLLSQIIYISKRSFKAKVSLMNRELTTFTKFYV